MRTREVWTVNNFTGGLMQGTKRGVAGSYVTGTGIDARRDPDGMTIGRKLVLDSSTTVVDRVDALAAVDLSGTISVFGIGNDGNIYRKTGTGDWSKLRTLGAGVGKGIGVFNNSMFYAADTALGYYTPLSGSPSFTDAFQTLTTAPSMAQFVGQHPMANFMNMIAIGNGRYLASYDSAGIWLPEANVYPPSTLVTCLEPWGDRLAVGTVDGLGRGFVYLWDGVAETYNTFFQVPAGGVHTMIANAGVLFIWAGPDLTLYTFSGGAPFDTMSIPNVGAQKFGTIFHGGATVFEGVPLFAVAGNTDSTTLTKGIYGFGSVSDNYPDVLSLDFVPSNAGAGLKIGSVLAAGSDLYVGWESDTGAGIDKLSTSPAASCVWESQVFDGGRPFQGISVYEVIINCSPLAANESITIKYKADRGSWVTIGTMSTTGESVKDFPVNRSSGAGYLQCREFQLQVTIATSGTTAPTIYSITTVYSINDLT
jgi:hypothetical protein